jgi:O-antigen/teichoic acid export membrane protein
MIAFIDKMRGPIALLAAMVAEKACYLAGILIISRLLSISDFGVYSFALYAGFTVATLAEFGFQPIITRDIVAVPERRRELLGVALLLKIPLALACVAIIGLMILFGEFEYEQAQLLWIIGLSQIAVTVSQLGNAVFRATQRLELESLSSFVRGALYLAASAGTLLAGFPLIWAAWAIFAASVASMAITLILATLVIRPAWPEHIKSDIWYLLAQAWPMGCSIIATSVFSTLSVIVLRLLMDDASVGWYNSAHSLASHIGFIPEVVTAALLPAMVVALQRNTTDKQPLTEMVLVMLGFALPIALGATLLAPQILSLIFGAKFAPAAPTLIWLMWTTPFSFVNVAYLLFLSTRKRQHVWLVLVLIGIALSALSLRILIPMFGSQGAAQARLAGEVGVWLIGSWMVRKALNYTRLVASIGRIGFALAGLFVVVWISHSAPVIISIGLGAAIYAILVATLGPWPVAVWRSVLSR